jgi:hypothetical protein
MMEFWKKAADGDPAFVPTYQAFDVDSIDAAFRLDHCTGHFDLMFIFF